MFCGRSTRPLKHPQLNSQVKGDPTAENRVGRDTEAPTTLETAAVERRQRMATVS